MTIHEIFWLILGLGMGIPSSLIIIVNMILKLTNGDNYELKLTRVAVVYAVALLGWACVFGIR